MSLSVPETFSCPYCMVLNDIDIDTNNDIGHVQILDCQICCSPIEVSIQLDDDRLRIDARRDDE